MSKIKNLLKEKEDEIVRQYYSKFTKYIEKLNDINKINELFADFTMLNIKLEGNDYAIINVLEKFKKGKPIDKKEYIKLQFEDILKFSKKKYTPEQYKEINETMIRLLPLEEKNWWQEFWDSFDMATGRKNDKS